MDLNLLLMHVRAQSQGVGDASCNKNNHPFVNADRSLGLVHNGRIMEYTTLKKRYEVKSECDSEILLRIFESSRLEEVPEEDRLNASDDVIAGMFGIKKIFSHINKNHGVSDSFSSAMAVAIGERGDAGRRDLWLFHNDKRPLWVIDAREALGQVFFVSLPEIWTSALRSCPMAHGMLGGKRHTIIELPTEEIWYFSINDEQQLVQGTAPTYYRWILNAENQYTAWNQSGPSFPIPAAVRKVPILSELGDNDEIPSNTINLPIISGANNRQKNKQKHKKEHKHNWRSQEEKIIAKKVKWTKDQAQYSDEANPTDYSDEADESANAELEEVITPYKGNNITPLELDERGEYIPALNHVARNIKDYTSGYDDTLNDNSYNDYEKFDIISLEKITRRILQATKDIETSAINMAHEGSLTPQMFVDNLEALKIILMDLGGCKVILDGVI